MVEKALTQSSSNGVTSQRNPEPFNCIRCTFGTVLTGFGEEKNLFSPNLEITNDSKPPEEPTMKTIYIHAKSG